MVNRNPEVAPAKLGSLFVYAHHLCRVLNVPVVGQVSELSTAPVLLGAHW